MTDHPALETLVRVNPRFARSVSLTRDTDRRDALDGYILRPNGRDMLRRMAAALAGESTARAWTLTGPYGSGKSSLALLIAQVLAGDDAVRRDARNFLSDADRAQIDAYFALLRGVLTELQRVDSQLLADNSLAV